MYEPIRPAIPTGGTKIFTIPRRTLRLLLEGSIKVDYSCLPGDARLDVGEFDPYRRALVIYVYSSSYERNVEGAQLPDGGLLRLMTVP